MCYIDGQKNKYSVSGHRWEDTIKLCKLWTELSESGAGSCDQVSEPWCVPQEARNLYGKWQTISFLNRLVACGQSVSCPLISMQVRRLADRSARLALYPDEMQH
jgi:hypothetical protein